MEQSTQLPGVWQTSLQFRALDTTVQSTGVSLTGFGNIPSQTLSLSGALFKVVTIHALCAASCNLLAASLGSFPLRPSSPTN